MVTCQISCLYFVCDEKHNSKINTFLFTLISLFYINYICTFLKSLQWLMDVCFQFPVSENCSFSLSSVCAGGVSALLQSETCKPAPPLWPRTDRIGQRGRDVLHSGHSQEPKQITWAQIERLLTGLASDFSAGWVSPPPAGEKVNYILSFLQWSTSVSGDWEGIIIYLSLNVLLYVF